MFPVGALEGQRLHTLTLVVANGRLADVGEGGEGGLSESRERGATPGAILTWLEVAHRVHPLHTQRHAAKKKKLSSCGCDANDAFLNDHGDWW